MKDIASAGRIVIKIGTSTLTHASGHINIRRLGRLVGTLADIKNSGRQIVLVSSGAIAVGIGKLGLKQRPADIPTKQAAAAAGQCELMYLYDKYFGEYNQTVAQILLTKDSLDDPVPRQNAINTFERLLELDAIPIVNENDTVSWDQIKIGDNDTLSAEVAALIGADALIILTDIDGLYDDDPREKSDAKLIPVVNDIDDKITAAAKGAGTEAGTGGMETKLIAARIAAAAGADTYIVNGSDPEKLYRLFDGEDVGTHFAL